MNKVLQLLLSWQLLVLIFMFLSVRLFSLQTGYLGGGMGNYVRSPVFWAHANFDGEHYIEIARFGYKPLQYFFFPLYPTLLKIVTVFFGNSLQTFVLSGILVSFISFLIGFSFFYKLLLLDYSKYLSKQILFLALLFPASFYFAFVYTESLFFMMAILSFYFARKGSWFLAGVFGGLSTMTRIVGLAIFPALIIEFYIIYKKEKTSVLKSLYFLLVPMGLLVYMFYLHRTTGDALAFFHNLSVFGEQRSNYFVLLPQVFYRYIFEILPYSTSYWPVFAVTLLEFGSGVFFLYLSFVSFVKLRLSYAVFLTIGYLIPTLSGSFSSLPRYVLVLFPAYILSAMYLNTLPKSFKIVVYFCFLCLLLLFTSMFVRGYWVS